MILSSYAKLFDDDYVQDDWEVAFWMPVAIQRDGNLLELRSNPSWDLLAHFVVDHWDHNFFSGFHSAVRKARRVNGEVRGGHEGTFCPLKITTMHIARQKVRESSRFGFYVKVRTQSPLWININAEVVADYFWACASSPVSIFDPAGSRLISLSELGEIYKDILKEG